MGKAGAIPFDWSVNGTKKEKKNAKITEPKKRSVVDGLTRSNASHELEATLRMADTFNAYLRNISKHPLLTKEEEVLLGQTISDGIEAKAAMARKDFRKGSEAELKFLIEQGDSAFSTFVLSNLRLVVWTAKKYYIPEGMTMEDMVQEGNLGLLRSIEKWDWRRGHRFSTYSTWWIRQSIDRGMAFARTVRLPEHMRLQVAKVKKEMSRFTSEHARPPTPQEMADRLEMPLEKYQFVAKQLSTIASLDAPIKFGGSKDNGKVDLLSMIKREGHAAPDRTLMANTLHESVHDLVNALTERQAFVIKKRFGLDGDKIMTLQEIGEIIGVTRERVRQIEARAMQEMQTGKLQQRVGDLREQMLEVEEGLDNDLNLN
jgi:RNA polymerase primary sigma factor